MYITAYTDPEIWKQITYRNIRRGMYEVSSYGRIRNTYTGKILKQFRSEKDYMIISLMCENDMSKNHTFKVHKIVAHEFLIYPEKKPDDGSFWTVDHIYGGYDGKADCSVFNLRYISDIENKRRVTTDSQNKILRGDESPSRKINGVIASDVNMMLLRGMSTPQIISIVFDKYNLLITKYIVHDIRRGKTWNHITHRKP